ncbi:MAG: GTP 3',8-cyclase MoaA [Bacteroidetes bacterium]|nr:GTP 3',8-cyclase MoaA [Bacteroidota bacterium]
MSEINDQQIYDNYNRPIQYLRLAVTDRCNLRCFYCMPEEGINFVPRKELLRYEEMERLVSLLAPAGISKIRITGGEPFVRRDLMPFLGRLTRIPGVKQVNITTNGVLTWKYMEQLKAIGISSINLSLDTLDPGRFFEITRRDNLKEVMKTMDAAQKHDIPLKINCVVIDGKNDEDILPLTRLAKDRPVDVRFIEEMPFNGDGRKYASLKWNHKKIIGLIKSHYPGIVRISDPLHSTSSNYLIPGFKGKVGVIAAYSRTFCGACNRVRVTALGMLKTCLYDDGVFDLKNLLRTEPDDRKVRDQLIRIFQKRAKDGFEAEKLRDKNKPVGESMATIGG